jgi:paraquat-inducible protein B
MTFNIGSQNAGVINNVQGDQHITGSQQGVAVTAEDARQALDSLRQAVAGAGLDEATAGQARAHLAELDTTARAAQPDRSRFARALERLTRLLAAAGPLATAGAALAGPLQTLALWLGALGGPILHLLPALA